MVHLTVKKEKAMYWYRPDGWEPILNFWILYFAVMGIVGLLIRGKED